ncbi:MAG: hypothetical protein R3B84_14530 [Zavarzinella sp.]
MADFRKLVIDLVVADGVIEADEIKLIKKSLYADKMLTRDEVAFLTDLRAVAARKKIDLTAFDKFYLQAIHDNILGNGIISKEEASLAQELVVKPKHFAEVALKFLQNLKKKATKVAPEFDALLEKLTPKK